MQTSPHNERPRLHHSQSAFPPQPGEIVYDNSFELCGYRFYVMVPPREEQPEALRRALQMHDKAEENVRETVRPKRNLTRLDADVEAKLAAAAKKVYGVIVQHAVVAWEPLDTDAGAVLFTADEQEKLGTAAQRQVGNKIVELFRLEG